MKSLRYLLPVTALVAGFAFTGCDRTVSKSQTNSMSSDGTVKSKETTVTQKSDGTTVKTEETKKTVPAKP